MDKKHFKFEEGNYFLMCSSLLNVLVLLCMSYENIILVIIMCDVNEIYCKIIDHPNMRSVLAHKAPIFLTNCYHFCVPLGSYVYMYHIYPNLSHMPTASPVSLDSFKVSKFLQVEKTNTTWEVILFMYFMWSSHFL